MSDHDNACPMAAGIDEPDNPGLVCECQTARRARADERGRADSECPHLLEAAALAAENIRLTTELDALRDGWGAWVCSDEIAKVLDGLLADAKELPSRAVYIHEVDDTFTMVFKDAVLALFEEVDRG